MRRKPGAFPSADSHATRLAWWVSFLATIAIVAILGMVRSAQAATLPLVPGGASVPIPLAVGDDEPEAEVAEEDEDEAEECRDEDEEECEAETAAEESDPCILRTASATVSVLKSRDKVRLTLHYTASSPAVVSVEYGLRGRRGALTMGRESKRFSKSGVFRDTEALTDAEMERVNAAREFDVHLHAVNTPGYCHRLFDRDLAARHGSPAGPVWTD